MEVLYVVGNDQNVADNLPLRYSLRSLTKFANCVDQVYVVGYPPSWLSDKVKTLTVHDEKIGKHWNILNCISKAIKHFNLDHDFLYSSDDHYLTKTINFDKFPYFAKGTLYSYFEYVSSKGKEPGKYQKSIIATRRLLEEHGYDTTMACCHRNTHIDGRMLDEVLDLAYQFSDYSNYGFEPSCLFNATRDKVRHVEYTMITQSQDEKVKNIDDVTDRINRGLGFFSTTPSAELNMRVISWMHNYYGAKSKWEK